MVRLALVNALLFLCANASLAVELCGDWHVSDRSSLDYEEALLISEIHQKLVEYIELVESCIKTPNERDMARARQLVEGYVLRQAALDSVSEEVTNKNTPEVHRYCDFLINQILAKE